MKSLPIDVYAQRRQRLLSQMGEHSIAILPAAQELTRSRDTEYAFRQDSYFYYLSGFNEPDAWLVLKPATATEVEQSILFCRDKDRFAEIWQGRRLGAENAVQQLAVDHAYALSEMPEKLRELVSGTQTLWYAQGTYPACDERISALLNELRNNPKKGLAAPTQQHDIRVLLDEMRLIKDAAELDVMRQAGEISAQAHCRAMQSSHAGVGEYQLEAEIHYHFARNGARFPAYSSIVGGGANACILHYTENQDAIANDELVLIDAGCELAGYAADITRTFPVNGVFTEPQRQLYQLVLDAQYAAFKQVKPGSNFHAVNQAAIAVIVKGLVDLGILSGDINTLIEQNAQRAYFMHGIGHWLGLDVHDVGDYQRIDGRQTRAFEPGMVLTIEPGIYIDDTADVDPKWHNIGIRIEDNLLITENGYENFTAQVPKEIADIESLMANAHAAAETEI
ncbi:Xaa-Pro aminopeptidase [Echinimonas agarilytica]|uniref:Xaa-Pro aminopeptidase n=1 Tax=Echinimonas agarilytica TaxID=1215918 RepID=A0AA41W585_9GAMM|nr:Xaa-Pro aminopeptidase [Echinimonas agarilytica]MCM2678890.1 Xaa-Pro aminopeptidase [Echinimonas agarilytica]